MLKFSKANAKTQALANDAELAEYLQGNRKIYSLDLLSGWSCPHAKDCLSKAMVQDNGKRKSKMVSILSSVAFQHRKKFSIPTYTIHASTISTYCVTCTTMICSI